MYALVVLTAALGIVSADVGLGYNYKPPHSHGSSVLSGSQNYLSPTYGAPVQTVGSGSGLYSSQFNNGVNYKGPDQPGYQGVNAGYQNLYNKYPGNSGEASYQNNANYQGGSIYNPVPLEGNYHNSLSSGSALPASVPAYVGSSNNGYQSQNHYHHSNEYHTSQKYQESYQVQHQPALIFKHFYVHAAPDDEVPSRPRKPVILPPPQKHYKIIFIKTPAQISAPQIVPVHQQNEEKTIVYVLVKKPEEIHDIVLPKLEQKPPAKPEVFFIKYNNKEGTQAVIDNIVKDYNNGQAVSGGAGIAESSSSGTAYYPGQSTTSAVSESAGAQSNVASGLGTQSFVGSDSGFGAAFASTQGLHSHSLSHSTPTLMTSGFVSHPLSINTGEATVGSNTSGSVSSTAGSGYDNSSSSSSSAAVTATDNASSISTSQGVPHETYGTPKFRE